MANSEQKRLKAKALETGWFFGEIQTLHGVSQTDLDREIKVKAIERLGMLEGGILADLVHFHVEESDYSKAKSLGMLEGRDYLKAKIDLNSKSKFAKDFLVGYTSMYYFSLYASSGKESAAPVIPLLSETLEEAGIDKGDIEQLLNSMDKNLILNILVRHYGPIPILDNYKKK